MFQAQNQTSPRARTTFEDFSSSKLHYLEGSDSSKALKNEWEKFFEDGKLTDKKRDELTEHRNIEMINTIKNHLNEHNPKVILINCGYAHIKGLHKELTSNNYEIINPIIPYRYDSKENGMESLYNKNEKIFIREVADETIDNISLKENFLIDNNFDPTVAQNTKKNWNYYNDAESSSLEEYVTGALEEVHRDLSLQYCVPALSWKNLLKSN